jgi:hypothetical protein
MCLKSSSRAGKSFKNIIQKRGNLECATQLSVVVLLLLNLCMFRIDQFAALTAHSKGGRCEGPL